MLGYQKEWKGNARNQQHCNGSEACFWWDHQWIGHGQGDEGEINEFEEMQQELPKLKCKKKTRM